MSCHSAPMQPTGSQEKVLPHAACTGPGDGNQRYLGSGPFGNAIGNRLWQVAVAPTPTMSPGEVLVGSFRLGARLHDRLLVKVLISSEDKDNFRKNMLTVRAEERVALAVRVPSSFVFLDELGVGFRG